MALEHEFIALDGHQRVADERLTRRALRLAQLGAQFATVRAYRAVFLDEHGELTPDAVRVIADIASEAGIGFATSPAISDTELRELAGRRTLALHVLTRLDKAGVKMRDIARKMREAEND